MFSAHSMMTPPVFSPKQIATTYARYPGMVSFVCHVLFSIMVGGLSVLFMDSGASPEEAFFTMFFFFGHLALVFLIPTIIIAIVFINMRRHLTQKNLVIHYAVKDFFTWSVIGALFWPLISAISTLVVNRYIERSLISFIIPPLLLVVLSTAIFYLLSILFLRERSDVGEPSEYKKNLWAIFLSVVTIVVIVGGVYYWATRDSIKVATVGETVNTRVQPESISTKPVISYPKDGSKVDTLVVKGRAKSGDGVWAYINYPKNELTCITSNFYANGGAATVDENGNFLLELAEPCSKEMTVVVSTADDSQIKETGCRSPENVSEPVTFRYLGKFPAVCSQ